MILSLLYVSISFATAEDLSLTYIEALELATKQNPQIQEARWNVQSANSTIMSAKAMFDPTLNFSAGQNRNTRQQFFAGIGAFNSETYGPTVTIGGRTTLPTGTTLSVDWTTSRSTSLFTSQEFSEVQQEISPIDTTLSMTLTQSLLQGFKTQYNKQQLLQAQQTRDSSEWIAIETIQQSLADTATAYWNVTHQAKLVQLTKEALNISLEEERLIQAKVDQGDLAPIEAVRVKAATLTSQVALLDTESAYISAKESLLLLLGESPTLNLILETPTPNLGSFDLQIQETEKEISTVLEQNPTLKRLTLSVSSAEENLRNAKHALLPELTGTARYSLTGWEDDFGAALEELGGQQLPGSYVGLNLDVPIANWGDRGSVEQRNIELEQARQSLLNMESTLTQQTLVQIRTLRNAERKAELAKMNWEVAKQSLAADRALQEEGRNIEKDILASLQTAQDAQIQYERAISDYALAWVALKRLQGSVK